MGFLRTQAASGKWVYACEIGKREEPPYCQGQPCRAHHCPFGWCQRYYICANCWTRPEVKAHFTKQAHERCRAAQADWAVRSVQRSTLLASGAYLRCSAESTDDGRVHVLFENQAKETIGRYMSTATYDAYPLLDNRTPEDYAAVGSVEEAPGMFEEGRTTKQAA